jgi:hypothetical protein
MHDKLFAILYSRYLMISLQMKWAFIELILGDIIVSQLMWLTSFKLILGDKCFPMELAIPHHIHLT